MTGHWTKYDRGDNLLFGAFVADILYSNLEWQLTSISILQDRIQHNVAWILFYEGKWCFNSSSILWIMFFFLTLRGQFLQDLLTNLFNKKRNSFTFAVEFATLTPKLYFHHSKIINSYYQSSLMMALTRFLLLQDHLWWWFFN